MIEESWLDRLLAISFLLGMAMFVIGFILDPDAVIERFRFLFFGY